MLEREPTVRLQVGDVVEVQLSECSTLVAREGGKDRAVVRVKWISDCGRVAEGERVDGVGWMATHTFCVSQVLGPADEAELAAEDLRLASAKLRGLIASGRKVGL